MACGLMSKEQQRWLINMSAYDDINILIAEDNDVTRDLMTGILQSRGYKIFGAIDGGSAIKVAEERSIDLALVDLNMSPKGGFDFVRYLTVNGMDIPVIIVTSDDSSDLLMAANNLGVRQVLNKPVEPERLIKSVERILSQVGLKQRTVAIEEHITHLTPDKLMGRVIELADKNAKSGRGGPFGAIVADAKGQVIGEGTNFVTSRVDPIAHAEVMAIRQAAEKLNREDLSDCTLYCSSQPTMMGQALILSVGIQKVYFGLSHDEIGKMRSRTKTADPIYQQLGHDEALNMFSSHQAQNKEEG